jgi:uncharacterized membrane protein YfhO
VLVLVVLPTLFPWLRYALYAFAGDYYRVYSLLVVLGLLLPALFALSQIVRGEALHVKTLAVTTIVLLGLLYAPFPGIVVDAHVQLWTAGLLLAEAFALLALGRPPYKNAGLVVLLVLAFTDVAFTANETLNDRDVMTPGEWRSRTGYNDETEDALAEIGRRDTGFYRVEKNYHSSPATFPGLNDPQAQDYFGTTSYHPFNQKYYVRFLEEMGLVDPAHEQDSRWANGLARTPVLLGWASVKYYLSRSATPPTFLRRTCEPIARFDKLTLCENHYVLPLGFGYDRVIRIETFRRLSPVEKQVALLRAYVSEEQTSSLKPYEPGGTSYSWDEYEADTAERARAGMTLTSFKQNEIVGTITLPEPELLFFSIPFDHGWRATIDGQDTEIERVNIGFMGLHLEPGHHQVTLRYRSPLVREGLALSLLFAGALVLAVRMEAARRWLSPRP